jgi:hypothetical protein
MDYNVEGQWKEKGGKYMDISAMLLPDPASPMALQQQQQQDASNAAASSAAAAQDDPFWS